MHQEPRTSLALFPSAVFYYGWQLKLGNPISADSRCVLRGIQLKYVPTRNWKLQLKMMIFFFNCLVTFSCMSGKSGS